MTDKALRDEKEWFAAQDIAWSPPPHLSRFKTPVPAHYFDAASGVGKRAKWSLLQRHDDDLVPIEQPDLVQDAFDSF